MHKTIVYLCFGVLSFLNEMFIRDLAFQRPTNLLPGEFSVGVPTRGSMILKPPPALWWCCNRNLKSWPPTQLNHLVPDRNLRGINDQGQNYLHRIDMLLPFPYILISNTPDIWVCIEIKPRNLYAPFVMFWVHDLGFYLHSFY